MQRQRGRRVDDSTLDLSKPADRMMAVQGMADLTHGERTVLSVIAYRDGSGHAWPSLQRIAEDAGMSRASASEHVTSLAGKGRLSRRKGQRASIYTIHYGPNPAVRENRTAETALPSFRSAVRGFRILPSGNP